MESFDNDIQIHWSKLLGLGMNDCLMSLDSLGGFPIEIESQMGSYFDRKSTF